MRGAPLYLLWSKLYYVWTEDVLKFHLPLSDVLMGNVLMQADLTLEGSHFPPRFCQVNSLIKNVE